MKALLYKALRVKTLTDIVTEKSFTEWFHILRNLAIFMDTSNRVEQRAIVFTILNQCSSPLIEAVFSQITIVHPLIMCSDGMNSFMHVP